MHNNGNDLWRSKLKINLQARAKRSVEKTGQCAREEVSSSFLGHFYVTNISLV